LAKHAFDERYLKGDLKIGLRRIDFGPPYYGIVLEALPNATKPPSLRVVSERDAIFPGQHTDLDQIPMLPRYVECVEVKQVRVPSRPRLQIFDDFAVGIGEPSYFFLSRVFPMKEGVSRATDGELHIYWVNMTVALSEDVSQQIQATSQTVYDESGFNIDVRRQAPDIGELVELLTVLRVQLFDQIVWGTLPPSYNSRFKKGDLGSRPINPSLSI
jgi:hypothetical protein